MCVLPLITLRLKELREHVIIVNMFEIGKSMIWFMWLYVMRMLGLILWLSIAPQLVLHVDLSPCYLRCGEGMNEEVLATSRLHRSLTTRRVSLEWPQLRGKLKVNFSNYLCLEHALFQNLRMMSRCWVRTGIVIPELTVVQVFDVMLDQFVFRLELHRADDITLRFVLVKNKGHIRWLVKGAMMFKTMLTSDNVWVGNHGLGCVKSGQLIIYLLGIGIGMWSLYNFRYQVPNAGHGNGVCEMPGLIGGCRTVATVLRLSLWRIAVVAGLVVYWNQMECTLLAYVRNNLVRDGMPCWHNFDLCV